MSIKYRLLLLLGLSYVTYMVATRDEPSCSYTVWAVDFPRWLENQVQPVVYHEGDWVDAFGRVIGTSATEDSDVCIP